MATNPSAIAKRKSDAELLVKNHYGKTYDNLAKLPASKQVMYRLRALVVHSSKSAGIALPKTDLDAFITEILSRSEAHANKAREDYIYSLTRRTKVPIYGASAINAWMLARLRAEEGQK